MQTTIPTRKEAYRLLLDGLDSNPGPWGTHSLTAAHCAEKIALACHDLDPEKAYILGLLHDIGRKFGIRHLGHVSDGFTYMTSLGYTDAARICLTHSFCGSTIDGYIGKYDVSDDELALIKRELATAKIDEYDRLIRLCDSLAGADGVMDIESRMKDVKSRYGYYPKEKWDYNLNLLKHFEEKAGMNIYILCEKDSFKPKMPEII